MLQDHQLLRIKMKTNKITFHGGCQRVGGRFDVGKLRSRVDMSQREKFQEQD